MSNYSKNDDSRETRKRLNVLFCKTTVHIEVGIKDIMNPKQTSAEVLTEFTNVSQQHILFYVNYLFIIFLNYKIP